MKSYMNSWWFGSCHANMSVSSDEIRNDSMTSTTRPQTKTPTHASQCFQEIYEKDMPALGASALRDDDTALDSKKFLSKFFRL